MRFLNTRTGLFTTVDNPESTPYAILSHVWAKPNGEQSYDDVQIIQDGVLADRMTNPHLPETEVLARLSPKIRNACERASADNLELIWIDTCCINKSSSAELSEAINSMYAWYADAAVCYAFLPDVIAADDPSTPNSGFRRSVWFTRGWTLQELIAPRLVIFLSSDWQIIGSKHGLTSVVQEITLVNKSVLVHERPPSAMSVAQRMSWASARVTTRKEDEAYSLMGLFGVNMPTIYGEGEKAFIRLQEEILKGVPDQSIFVWERATYQTASGRVLLAPSPAAFSHSRSVKTLTKSQFVSRLRVGKGDVDIPPPVYSTTPYGIRAMLPYVADRLTSADGPDTRIIPLACEDGPESLLALILTVPSPEEYAHGVGTVVYDHFPSSLDAGAIQCTHWPPDIDCNWNLGQLVHIVRLWFPGRLLGASDASYHGVSEFYIVDRPSLLPPSLKSSMRGLRVPLHRPRPKIMIQLCPKASVALRKELLQLGGDYGWEGGDFKIIGPTKTLTVAFRHDDKPYIYSKWDSIYFGFASSASPPASARIASSKGESCVVPQILPGVSGDEAGSEWSSLAAHGRLTQGGGLKIGSHYEARSLSISLPSPKINRTIQGVQEIEFEFQYDSPGSPTYPAMFFMSVIIKKHPQPIVSAMMALSPFMSNSEPASQVRYDPIQQGVPPPPVMWAESSEDESDASQRRSRPPPLKIIIQSFERSLKGSAQRPCEGKESSESEYPVQSTYFPSARKRRPHHRPRAVGRRTRSLVRSTLMKMNAEDASEPLSSVSSD